jgi:hypothetical protein
MARDCDISHAVEMAQTLMLDLAERKHGITRKALHLATGIPISTLKSYEEGTAMPVTAFVKMAAVIPNELLSLMLEPGEKAIADAEPDETDLDDLARAAVDVLQKYVAARHPDSPGGIRIVHSETADIKLAAKGIADRAGKVAA